MLRYRAFGRQGSGDTEGALDDLGESLRLDPANPWTLNMLSGVLLAAGEPEEAAVRDRQAVALLPTNWRAHQAYGEALDELGRREEAAEAFGHACLLSQTQSPCTAHGLMLHKIGQPERAAEAMAKAQAMPTTAHGAFNLACYFALRREREPALGYLRQAIDLGLADPTEASDPDLASLRGDEEFEKLWKPAKGESGGE